MHLVNRRHLREAAAKYPDAAGEIAAWATIVSAIRWHRSAGVREIFPDADQVDGYIIFNIRHNHRLITVIHYAKTAHGQQTDGHVYIRSFLTHREYDKRSNWDRRFGKV